MVRTDEVLTAREAAGPLGAHVETIRRLARRGELPSYKIGKDWRFRREALLRWAGSHHQRQREPRVLVVDDDPMVRDLVRRILEPEGCRVSAAADGEHGLQHVARERPDLVLLDLKMPGMNGVEFLKRSRGKCPDTPVMVVMGYPDSELMSEAMRYGPITLLTKPIEADQLTRTIRLVLGGPLEGPARQPQERSARRNSWLQRRAADTRAVKKICGLAIAQHPVMPQVAIAVRAVDEVLGLDKIGRRLRELRVSPKPESETPDADPEATAFSPRPELRIPASNARHWREP